jgi:hypothetical protein
MSPYDVSTSAVVEEKAPPTTPAWPNPTHEIEISLEYLQGSKKYQFRNMNVGETVRYFSNDGEVTIHLTGQSPFHVDVVPAGTHVSGGVILTLVKSSEDLGLPNDAFQVGCSVTLPNGDVVGWPKLTNAGGDQPVGRPGH